MRPSVHLLLFSLRVSFKRSTFILSETQQHKHTLAWRSNFCCSPPSFMATRSCCSTLARSVSVWRCTTTACMHRSKQKHSLMTCVAQPSSTMALCTRSQAQNPGLFCITPILTCCSRWRRDLCCCATVCMCSACTTCTHNTHTHQYRWCCIFGRLQVTQSLCIICVHPTHSQNAHTPHLSHQCTSH